MPSWRCLLCDARGTTGSFGMARWEWHAHYMSHHYESLNAHVEVAD